MKNMYNFLKSYEFHMHINFALIGRVGRYFPDLFPNALYMSDRRGSRK